MVHQRPLALPAPQGEHSHHIRGAAVKWVASIGLSTMTALSIFYAVNWQPLTHLPELAKARVEHEHVQWTPLNRVSPWFQKALIATEDRSFYTNWGISFQGIARAAWVDLQTGQFTQGGSTITQQLIRNLMLSPVKTIPRKVSGILLSLMATDLYSKQQILTMYMNEVYLGDHAYGVGQAAQSYFGVPASQLTLPEAALLAGLPQAPSAYDPLVNFKLAKQRQWEVLNSMVHDHMITLQQALHAYQAPLPLKSPRQSA
ncbi:transglycosylase domain-containing protein [Sulfobacillus thermosulfidooxidans]|uniref:transglycosylase domain-containing protein n=1 Tax=Sulfobacillus thermosulfidooxidans TaxID=28034 RepID=UPI0009F88229|nr:biosynthetic peptidoglycan transglycosylase [Sulfobacillus thermosulfidooxidans]